MNTVLVWLLIIVPSSSQNSPFQHGPFADLESCQRVQSVYLTGRKNPNEYERKTQCVQVLVPAAPSAPAAKKG